jgi:hypothetical protein
LRIELLYCLSLSRANAIWSLFFYLVLFQVQKRREEPYVMVDL